jgi:hypothetical protein
MPKLTFHIPIPIGIDISWYFGEPMKKKVTKKLGMLPEYDFSKGVRGKYSKQYKSKAKSKKVATPKVNVFEVPQLDWQTWFGQWLVASMVMEAWKSTGKLPKKFLVPVDAIKDQADGSGLMNFEAVYDE